MKSLIESFAEKSLKIVIHFSNIFRKHHLWGWIREDLLESLKKPKLLQPNPKVAGRDVAGLIFETQPESPSFFFLKSCFYDMGI